MLKVIRIFLDRYTHIKEEQEAAKSQIEGILALKDKTNPEIQKYFQNMSDFIHVVTESKDINAMIITGGTGSGKSQNVLISLMNDNKIPGTDFVLMNAYATPLLLYTFLYNNRKKIVIIDDCPKLFQNDIAKNIFLATLWNPTGKRTVDYKSSSEKLKVPQKFEFEGKVIALMNELPTEIEAIKSRCLLYNINFSHDTIIKLMYEMSKVQNVPDFIVDYIRDNTNASYDINFRTMVTIYNIYKAYPADWKRLAIEQLEFNPIIKALIKVLDTGITTKQKVSMFTKLTGLGQRSFYNYKNELRKRTATVDLT